MAPPLEELHLEGQGHQGLGAVHLHDVLFAAQIGRDGGRALERCRHDLEDAIEEGLDAPVAQRAPPEEGVHLPRHGAGAQGRPDALRGDLGLFEHELLELLVDLRTGQEHALPVLLEHLGIFVADGPHVDDLPVLAGECDAGLLDQVEHRAVLEGQADRHRAGAEALLEGVDAALVAGTRSVHLVDEDAAGHVEAVCLTPHRLGLGLHTAHGIEDDDRAVEHPHGPLHLDREVHVARRVDDLDEVLAPRTARHCRADRDAVLLLLGDVVHVGTAIVDLADAVVGAGVEQDPLGERGLAGIDVCGDADVAHSVEVWRRELLGLGHDSLLARRSGLTGSRQRRRICMTPAARHARDGLRRGARGRRPAPGRRKKLRG